MQIKGQTGWSIGLHQLEREYNTIVNIACKCYVISEKKQYNNDGSFNIEYEVVFLYEESEFRDEEFKLATPRFNIYSQCINSTLVNQLFDTFEEAQSLAKEYNNELLKRKIGHLAYKKDLENNIKSLKLEHQETLDRYNQIEQHLEQKTMNMSVQKTPNIEELIEKVTKILVNFLLNQLLPCQLKNNNFYKIWLKIETVVIVLMTIVSQKVLKKSVQMN